MNEDKDDAGHLSAYVDTGEQVVMISDGAHARARGSTVVSKWCSEKILEVIVSGTSKDSWAGNIYYSLDDGSNWHEMVCKDCDGEETMPIVVDRNGKPDARFASCVGGKSCSVVVSDEIVFELILWMFGIKH